jgi:hypothetical protein
MRIERFSGISKMAPDSEFQSASSQNEDLEFKAIPELNRAEETMRGIDEIY